MNESDDDILKDRDYATKLLKFLVIVLEDLNSKLYQSTRNIIKTGHYLQELRENQKKKILKKFEKSG